MRKVITLILVLAMTPLIPVYASTPIQRWRPPVAVDESNDIRQNWVAWTYWSPERGFWIVYNPNMMAQYPWHMQVFIRAHEYGHVNTAQHPGHKEANADCWGAWSLAQTDPDIVRAVLNTLENVTREHDRAEVVRKCSGL